MPVYIKENGYLDGWHRSQTDRHKNIYLLSLYKVKDLSWVTQWIKIDFLTFLTVFLNFLNAIHRLCEFQRTRSYVALWLHKNVFPLSFECAATTTLRAETPIAPVTHNAVHWRKERWIRVSPSSRLGRCFSFNSQTFSSKAFLSKRFPGNNSFFKVNSPVNLERVWFGHWRPFHSFQTWSRV